MAWNRPKWLSSWHNFSPDVTRTLSFPERIAIEDWTLEGDGEETPGMVFTRAEKLAIARMLDETGVHSINAGLVSSSFPEDLEVVREIAQLGLKTKVGAKISTVDKSGIDLALQADLSNVLMEFPSNDLWLESQELSRATVIDRSIEATTYAKEHGLHVTFGLQDAPRTDQNFLKQFITCLDEVAKANAICLSDSWGTTSPQGFAHLIRVVRELTRLPIAIHCHNDFGLATANALAGLAAGANIATVTVNGIGERCGLTSLEELVLSLRVLYGIDIGVNFEKFCELSRLVEGVTGNLISKLKPVVGERAFAWESDQSIQSIRKLQTMGQLKAGLSYEPSLVGNTLKFYPGKKSGIHGIKWEAERLGSELTDNQAQDLLNKILELSGRKQQPNGQEFLNLVRKYQPAT